MADIWATFENGYGESRRYVIVDQGRDPNSPPVIFDGYLDPDAKTDWLALYADGSYGRVVYQRSDGGQQVVDSITNESNVRMS